MERDLTDRAGGFLQSFAIVSLVALIFWLPGYLFIVCTRLFMKPFTFPGLMTGGFVGFAVFWFVLNRAPDNTYVGYEEDHATQISKEDKKIDLRKTSSIHDTGPDCVYKDGVLTFGYIPDAPVTMKYTSFHKRNEKIYLIADNKNPKILHPSTEKEKIVPVDLGKNAKLVSITIHTEPQRAVSVHRYEASPKMNKQQWESASEFGWWFSAIVYTLGCLLVLGAHGEAFKWNEQS